MRAETHVMKHLSALLIALALIASLFTPQACSADSAKGALPAKMSDKDLARCLEGKNGTPQAQQSLMGMSPLSGPGLFGTMDGGFPPFFGNPQGQQPPLPPQQPQGPQSPQGPYGQQQPPQPQGPQGPQGSYGQQQPPQPQHQPPAGNPLQGSWTGTLQNGTTLVFSFNGNQYFVTANGQQIEAGTFALNGSRLEYSVAFGQAAGQRGVNTWQLSGSVLVLTGPNGQSIRLTRQA